MRQHVMAMTYQPKIEPVKDGRCTQTIRKGRKVSVGDEISFIMWKSRWISKRVTVTKTIPISISALTLREPWDETILYHRWDSIWPKVLARKDFIDPPTGKALRDVLFGYYGVPCVPEEYQIIRWSK